MDRIQLRRDIAANWSLNNPILGLGEIGFVLAAGGSEAAMANPIQFKVGDGILAWNNLPLQTATSLDAIVELYGIKVPSWDRIISGDTSLSRYLVFTTGSATGSVQTLQGEVTASGQYSYAEGYKTLASGQYSHAEGNAVTASNVGSHAEGYDTDAKGQYSHAEGYSTTATGSYSHAEGQSTWAGGTNSHTEGSWTGASGNNSHAEGDETSASGDHSHAEGFETAAQDTASHAEGMSTAARGAGSHAEGSETEAVGNYSHAEGNDSHANGSCSHAEGASTAGGNCSHAEGWSTTATGHNSHAEGKNTNALNETEHAEGYNNISNKTSDTYGNAGNTQHSVGIGTSFSNSKNAFEIMQNGDAYVYGIGGYDGTNATSSASTPIQKYLTGNTVSITWADLKSLRDSGSLLPGQTYRITDYQCTVSSSITYATAATHSFDIITFALDATHLSEDAWAAHHEGDTYFASSSLDAWELKYCLDNDADRFAWASSSGKGVIWYMKDEFDNECPYDFKNIMFWRAWDSTKSLWSTISTSGSGVAAYTFSSEGTEESISFTDYSLDAPTYTVYGNIVGKLYSSTAKRVLNNICFFGRYCCLNIFEDLCENCTLGSTYCFSNIFGSSCSNITLGTFAYSNVFGNTCTNVHLGRECSSNTFGKMCNDNSFGYRCQHNTLGSKCCYNIFGSTCKNNILKTECTNNTFGTECAHNVFGGKCSYNTFGNYCQSNTFGSLCYYVVFGNNCCYNTFGNYCYYNRFMSESTGTVAGDYFYHNKLENGASFNIIYSASSSQDKVKNYNIKSSMVGTNSSKNLIAATRNLDYDTIVAKNSSGTIKTFCLADLAS